MIPGAYFVKNVIFSGRPRVPSWLHQKLSGHCSFLLELYKQVADSNSHKLKLVTSDQDCRLCSIIRKF